MVPRTCFYNRKLLLFTVICAQCLANPALAADQVVELPAVLHPAFINQLKLAALAVHGLEVLQRCAGVVRVVLLLLHLALIPLNISSAVPQCAVHCNTFR